MSRKIVNGKQYHKGDVIIDEAGKPVIFVIRESDFKFNNERPEVTGYEFIKSGTTTSDEPTENRKKLEDKANELNITYRNNIGDDNLLKKINEIEPEFKL